MTEPRQIKRLGWKPDLPDIRDHYYQLEAPTTVLPSHVNLARGFQLIYDQGDLGSCTANAIAAAFAYDRKKLNQSPDFIPSRLLIYYNERVIENSVSHDAGASLRDGIKAVASLGACDEALWPYVVTKFAVKPPIEAYAEAAKHQVQSYARLTQDLLTFKTYLAAGFPFVFGFSVYSSFMSSTVAKTGLMPIPNTYTERLLGGHAVCCVGYNSHNLLMCRNSWGTGWGDPDFPGYFWMPPEAILNPGLASDFWSIKTVEA